MIEWSSITKIVLYICSTVVIIVMIDSCELDPAIIEECEVSCSRLLGNNMSSVTNRECICSIGKLESKSSDDIWVLPRN